MIQQKMAYMCTFVMIMAILLFVVPNTALAAVQGTNKAIVVMCDMILLIRGRIGRALTMIAILGLATAFYFGSITWNKVLMLSIGIGILYGAETVAYLLLPSTVRGLSGTMASGKVIMPNQDYTPEEIVREVCPELSSF